MNILYVAPRFHTNQVPIIKGLINKNYKVEYFVRYCGKNEEHCGVKVVRLDASIFSRIIEKIWKQFGENVCETKMLMWFIPQRKACKNYLKEFEPDVVILRDRTPFSLMVYRFCKKNEKCKCLLYNQSPIYFEEYTQPNILKNIWRMLFPRTRITVSEYTGYPKEGAKYIKDKDAFFLPFVPRCEKIKEREYFETGIVRILDSGKFRKYKNHSLLIDAAGILKKRGYTNFYVTIQGQACNMEEEQELIELKKQIKENELEDFFTLTGAVPYSEMETLFYQNDVYVLPSRNEVANVSIVDAMSYGLATIAPNDNGTSSYIKEGETGLIFEGNNVEDLASKIQEYLDKKDLIISHGQKAANEMAEEFNFEKYFDRFKEVLHSCQF